MMGRTDLLPAVCRETFIRQRARRRWLLTYCGASVLLAIGFSAASAHHRTAAKERDQLRTSIEDRLLQNEEAGDLLAKIRELEERLTRYNDLAWPVRMTEVIGSVGAIVPDGVALTALTMSPRIDRIRIPAKKGRPASERIERWLTVELQGIAADDFTVSQIVSGLDINPLFSTVALDFARQRSVDETEAREFRIQAEIDLDARYVFTEVSTEVLP